VTASAFHRPACKQLILSAAVAAWGLALAISVSTLWVADPPPGQLPSYMTSKALDARGPMRSVLTLIVLPPLMVLLSRPLLRHAALTIERRWAPAATIERWAGAFGSVAGNWVAYTGVSRAGHALFDADNARKLGAAQAYVDRLPAGTTFFDFSNMAGLYYFFDRRLPIRQLETPMYQTERGQREVIARLESDQSVVAALMCFPNRGEADIDGIPSAVRAPLVFQYLREHFTPDYQSEGVVFWRRIR
jgi:hypothetical protein